MFGEKPIFGNDIRHIDAKGRLVLPKFTFVEPHEILYYVVEDGSIRVYNEKNMKSLLNSMQETTQLILDDTNCTDQRINVLRNNKKKILDLYNLLYSSTNSVRVDNAGRINISKANLEANKQYNLVGTGDSLLIYDKNPSDFSIYDKVKVYTK